MSTSGLLASPAVRAQPLTFESVTTQQGLTESEIERFRVFLQERIRRT